jgi:hypothetical protein
MNDLRFGQKTRRPHQRFQAFSSSPALLLLTFALPLHLIQGITNVAGKVNVEGPESRSSQRPSSSNTSGPATGSPPFGP